VSAFILRSKPSGYDRETQFKNGKISIGWARGCSFEGLTRNKLSEVLSDKTSATTLSMVQLFVHMPVGSIVLTPSLENSNLIHIFITTSTYKYDASSDNKEIGNPHYIEANFLKTIPKKSLPNEVLHSLSGARKTLSRISQYYDVLTSFINRGFDVEDEKIHSSSNCDEMKSEAMKVVFELLSSQNEEIRLKAAALLLTHSE
jgi:predicted Zn-ribbon and HTH transcriptional regulator